MSDTSPSGVNYLQPSVRIWGIQLELGRELCKEKDLNSCASTIPPRARNAIFVCHGTRLEERGCPCPGGHDPRCDKAWLNATRRAAEFLRTFRGIRRVPRLDCSQTYHEGTEEQANADDDAVSSTLR